MIPPFSNRNRLLLIGILVLLSFLLRFWDVAAEARFLGDESQFVPLAGKFLDSGMTGPNAWLHPPCTFYLTTLSIKLFGDNPYGWRMPNVALGTLSVLVLFLLASAVFQDDRVSFLASLILALDPMHMLLSRTNFMELAPVFFFLCAAYVTVLYMQARTSSLSVAGVALGLSIASKWYFVPGGIALLLFVFLRKGGERTDRTHPLYVFSTLGVLPLLIYVLSYYPHFKRGYGLVELFQMNVDALRAFQSIEVQGFASDFLKASYQAPWKWFVSSVISARIIGEDGELVRYLVLMTDPPIWLLTIPAFAYLVHAWRRERDPLMLLPVVLFAATYMQFLVSSRPIFLYSSVAVLPFAAMAIAFALVALVRDHRLSYRLYAGIVLALVSWGCYLYPFITRRFVPAYLYAPLVS